MQVLWPRSRCFGALLPADSMVASNVCCCGVQGLKRPELRDELYMQLVKQTRGNPSPSSRSKAWGLFNLVAASMPPSKDFTGLISEYVHSALQVRRMNRSPTAGLAADGLTCMFATRV